MKAVKVPLTNVLYLMMLMIGMQGCGTLGYGDVDIDTTRKAIVVANAEIRGANLLLQDLIQRRAIDRDAAQRTKDALDDGNRHLRTALTAIDVSGDPATAATRLELANTSITVALSLLGPLVEGDQ